MRFIDLGLVGFQKAFEIQSATVQRIAAGTEEETVYLLEHPPVFTLGRRGKEENLIVPESAADCVEVVRINRGGDITYHGPGQLVVYPHLDLTKRDRDLHKFLRDLEECLIMTAARFSVTTFRKDGLTGVWTDQGKLASIGVGVRQWISMHGFALNVSTDLGYFSMINPCGIPECPMTSLSELTGRPMSVDEVKPVCVGVMKEVFGS